jgi:type I restriction enzyme S subunit
MEGREMPVGWASIELIDAGIWGSGGTPSRKNPRYYENGSIPWLVIGDLNDQAVEEFSTSITELGLINSSAKLIPTGSLLVAMYGSIGKLGITTFPCTTNQAIAFCIPNEELVELRYLFHALANAKPELIAKGQGGAQQNISQGILKEHLIPLSPLNEQRRIAAKLDTTLAAVEVCRQRLDGVAAILKRFRQAVLAAATSGELTRKWREERGKQDSTEKVSLGEVILEMRNGLSPKPTMSPPGTKILRIGAVRSGSVDWEDYRYLDLSAQEIKAFKLQLDDLLFTRYNGTLEFVGVCARVGDLYDEYVYPDKLIRARCDLGRALPAYVEITFGADNVRSQVEGCVKSSAGQKGISGADLKGIRFSLPPIEEQQEIVRRAQHLFTLADQLEARLTSARKIVDRLTPALLAKAFRGELVPQDPNDEPASELLAKLKSTQSDALHVSPRRRAKQPTRRQTMSISDKDSVKAVILNLKTDQFSYDELRDQAGGDYESLKGILFELLEEQSPVVRQFFDQEAKAMKLERIRP